MKFFLYILLFTLFISCEQQGLDKKADGAIIPALVILSTNPALHFEKGLYYYKQVVFSGHIIEKYGNDTIHHDDSYLNGRQEGWQYLYYPNGYPSEKRYYHLGEKDGLHTGWWPNGQKRFEYHFTNGQYNGDYKEWYAGGQPYKEIHYSNGIDDNGKGWRENGKVYMSYITKEGRRYGLINANLCYSLKNENGEFIKTVNDTLAIK